jgi:hypothetical protein
MSGKSSSSRIPNPVNGAIDLEAKHARIRFFEQLEALDAAAVAVWFYHCSTSVFYYVK